MRWVPDRTGRFPQRPHYDQTELDQELGDVVRGFLRERYGAVRFPISTEDLTLLIERYAVLDPYADLSAEGADVEGVTYFRPGGRPLVRVASALSTDDRRENRYRTTLTHELTHVRLHAFLWALEAPSLPLLPQLGAAPSGPRCRRKTIIDARAGDWMEWQAAYGCGALLMPASDLHVFVRDRVPGPPVSAASDAALAAVRAVAAAFGASEDAARVRLTKLGYLHPASVQPLPI